MKKMVISLAVALVCVSSAFADNETITSAAINPESIPQVVKSLNNGTSLADFTSDVMDAIGKMPLPPKEKSAKLLAAAEGFFKIAGGDGKEIDKIITALVSNVPSTNLAKWTRQFRQSTTADFVNALPQSNWEDLVSKVCSNINKLSNTSDDDKVVITSFALILLARDEDLSNPDDVIARVGGYLPESYKDQVLAALPDAFNDDFSSLLPADVLDNPGNTEGGDSEGGSEGGNTGGGDSEGDSEGGNTEGGDSEGGSEGGNTGGGDSEGGSEGGNTEGGDSEGGSEGGNTGGGDEGNEVVPSDPTIENPGEEFVEDSEQVIDGPNGERGNGGKGPKGPTVRPTPQSPNRPFVPPVVPVHPHHPIIPVPYPNQF